MGNYYQNQIGRAMEGVTDDETEENRLQVKVRGPKGESHWLTTPLALVEQIRNDVYGFTAGVQADLRLVQRYYAMKIMTTSESIRHGGWLIYGADGSLQGFADEGHRGNQALKDAAAALAYDGYDPRKERWDYVSAEYVGNAIECIGPHVTVRLHVQGIVDVPTREYRTALKHGNKDNPGTRQF